MSPRDGRPLAALLSRAGVTLGIAVVSDNPLYPHDPDLRAERVPGVRACVRASDGVPLAIWLELGRECGPLELTAMDGKGWRRTIVSGRTPGAFRAAFDAWMDGREAEDSIAHKRGLKGGR